MRLDLLRVPLPSACAIVIVLIAITHGALARDAFGPEGPTVLVRLSDDESIRGELIEERADAIVIVHPVLGTLVIPRAAIVSIEPIATAAPQDATPSATAPEFAPVPESVTSPETAPEIAPEVVPAPGAPAPAPAPKSRTKTPDRPGWASSGVELIDPDSDLPAPGTIEWLANIQASLSGVNSDTNQLDVRFAGAFVRRTSLDSFKGDAEYYYSVLNNETTDNNLLGTLVYDRFFEPSNWLAFGKGQYQYDAFQDWENRLSAYAGLGYRIFRAPPLALVLKGGLGATHEFGNINETTPEAYAEVAFHWRIDPNQHLEGSVYVAPQLSDFGQYRILGRLNWVFRLDTRGLSIVGGLREEYQATVGEGSTNNDFRYYLGLRYDF